MVSHVLHKTFLLIMLGITRILFSCGALKFEDIAREHIKEENAFMGQEAKTNFNSTLTPPSSGLRSFDERTSDQISFSVLRFAHDISQQLAEQTSYKRSEVFSPVSIMSALALLMLGAKGRSYQELRSIFGLDYEAEVLTKTSKFHTEFGYLLEDLQIDDSNGGGGGGEGGGSSPHLRKNANWRNTVASKSIRNSESTNGKFVDHIINVANGMFTQTGYELNQDYLYASRLVYRSTLVPLDFSVKPIEARNFINQWVEDSTFGKIPEIINGDITRGTKVILASALYFKGFWENSFFATATAPDYFYPDGMHNPPIQVQMMATGGEFPFYNSVEYDCRIIGLPYKGNLSTMYIIQPNQSSRSKLKNLHQVLDASKIEELISKMVQKTAMLALPKMHLVRSLNLRDTLNRLGIKDIFIDGVSDLSLIGGAEGSQPNYAELTSSQASSSQAPLQAAKVISPELSQGSSSPGKVSPSSSPVLSQTPTTIRTKTIFEPKDRFNEPALIFNRFGLIDEEENTTDIKMNTQNPLSPDNTYESGHISDTSKPSTLAGMEGQTREEPLLNRDTSKTFYLNNLESKHFSATPGKSDLFVQDIVHKVDIEINEQGTEAAAATLTYLRRSGTDILFRADTPFLFMIRHDPTKLVLFYGIVNEPDM